MLARSALILPLTIASLAAAEKRPTAGEAEAFVKQVDTDLRRLWVARDRAGWVNENFLTDDTDALAAAGEEATAGYMTEAIPKATRFAKLKLAPEIARQLYLVRIAQIVPAPKNAPQRAELSQLESAMQSTYGKGQYCPTRLAGKCLKLDDLEKTLATSRDYKDLVDAWTGWHSISRPMRPQFQRYVELGNIGSKEIGFDDLGALWRSGYDMPPEAFAKDEARLWEQVKPLYRSLHCYVRRKLHARYGEHVPDSGPIPVPVLGNMWGQEWASIADLVTPYPNEPSLDVGKKIVEKKMSPTDMVKLGESFFLSLGFAPLPATFWERSLFTRPRDREVVCHASAWDVQWNGDLRIKMCIEPTEKDLITIHHELGHDFYFQSYEKLPILFEQGANDGFHEGIGDTIALSVTPSYLKRVGLLDQVADNPKAKINHLMKMALEKIAFLPFALVVDQWRWDVFRGAVDPAHYNSAWWQLKKSLQGEAPPVERTEADFDPGAKYHVAASVPYARYFMAVIYQFQFHRALCAAAGFKGPLDECSIYGSKEAGQKFRAMLSLGASKPWPEAMEVIAGQREADASAVEAYFEPLKAWLDTENKGQACGW